MKTRDYFLLGLLIFSLAHTEPEQPKAAVRSGALPDPAQIAKAQMIVSGFPADEEIFKKMLSEVFSPKNYLSSWARPFDEECDKIPRPGKANCLPNQPRALIAYDRYAYASYGAYTSSNNEVIVKRAPGMDCALVKRSLEQSPSRYCVEAIGIENSGTLEEILKTQPDLKNRYQYVSNVTHGNPGNWYSNTSICGSTARKHCFADKQQLSLEDYKECIQRESAKESNKASCPCWEKQNAFNTEVNLMKSLNSQSSAGNLQLANDIITARSRADAANVRLKACEGSEANKQFYSDSINPVDFTNLLSQGGLLISHSCSTAEETQQTINLTSKICEGAPENIIFNLGRRPTYGTLLTDASEYNRIQREVAAALCTAGKCAQEFSTAKIASIGPDQSDPHVINPATGSFVCFQCVKGAPHPIACTIDMAGLTNLSLEDYDRFAAELRNQLPRPSPFASSGSSGQNTSH